MIDEALSPSPNGNHLLPQPPPEAPRPTVELIREGGLRREIQIRKAGAVFYLIAFVLVLSAMCLFQAATNGDLHDWPAAGGAPLFLLLTGAVYFVVGYGLENFAPWSRPPAILMGVVFLFLLPVMIPATLWLGYLLCVRPGPYLFRPEYQQAIRETSDRFAVPKTSPRTRNLAILAALFFLAVIGPFIRWSGVID